MSIKKGGSSSANVGTHENTVCSLGTITMQVPYNKNNVFPSNTTMMFDFPFEKHEPEEVRLFGLYEYELHPFCSYEYDRLWDSLTSKV